MKLKCQVALIFLFLFSSTVLRANEESRVFSGRIVDESGNALAGANILAYKSDGAVVTYSIADGTGYFEIKISPVVSYIVVSLMGMKPVRIDVGELSDGQTVTMVESVEMLRTVTVTQRRIRESGDTLTYSVGSFKQAQDRSIEDVIRRMPGIDVKPSGAIEYQGKEISKFYIEGLDLMGGKYSLASGNISADKVKDVQVLENHQSVKSLRGIQYEERAAMNIVLKDEERSVWSALVEAGGGYAERNEGFLYDNRLMAMQFGRKFQTMMVYKGNDTGTDISNELNDFSDGYREENGILSLMSVPKPGFDKGKYTFNNSHLVSGNWLLKAGKDSELSLQVDGLLDREKLNWVGETFYLDVADVPSVREAWDISGKRNELGVKLNYILNSDRTYVRSRTQCSGKWNSSDGMWSVGDDTTGMFVYPEIRMVAEDFSLSHTTPKGNVWQVESSTGDTYLPGSLLTLSSQEHKLRVNKFSTKNALTFKLKSGQHYFSGKAGIDYKNQFLCGDFYSYALPYWEQGFQFHFGNHNITANCRLGYLWQKYGAESTGNIVVDPSLSWNWKPDGMNEFRVSYSIGSSEYNTLEMMSGPVYYSYRNVSYGLGQPGIRRTHILLAGWTFRNPLAGFFFNIRPAYSRTSGNLLYESTLDSGVYCRTATGEKYASDYMGVSFRAEESFPSVRLIVGLSGTASSTFYSSVVRGYNEKYALDALSASADISYRLSSLFNFQLKSKMSASRRRCNDNPSLSTPYVVDWAHNASVNLFPLKGFRIGAECDVYHSNEKDYGVNSFLDICAGYKRGKWEISCSARNVVGTNEYRQVRISSTLQTNSITELRPREYLLKFCIEF